MRTAINALTEELRRLKGVGVKSVTVSESSLAALRRAVGMERDLRAGLTQSPSSAPKVAVGIAGEPTRSADGAKTAVTAVVPAPPVAPILQAAGASAPALRPGSGPAGVRAAPKFVLPEGSKVERWQALKALVEADEVCHQNVRPGKKIVLGVGSLDARIMFVGEAPGAEEETQGEPFVGPAGQLLTKMIQAMGLQRSDVYIGNIMNWRPQMPVEADGLQVGNRPPTTEEMAYCLPYLAAQIDVVQPEFLVALGATASHGLLGAGAFKALGEVRGKWREHAGKPLMITYHPSYILRNPTNRSKRMIWDDLLQVMERASLPISVRQRGYFLDK